jgi:hypothetical protein
MFRHQVAWTNDRRYRKIDDTHSPLCANEECNHSKETQFHILEACPRYEKLRNKLKEDIIKKILPEVEKEE